MRTTTSLFRRALQGAIPVGFAALTATGAGAAEFSGPLWGGSGGRTAYSLDCGSGGVLVGFYGKSGRWLDQVGTICRTINASGTLGSTFTRGPVGGTGGKVLEPHDCPTGYVVGAVGAYTLWDITGTYIEGVTFYCHKWDASTRRRRPGDNPKTLVGGLIPNNPIATCPSDKVGKALKGKHGIYIDSTRFVCDAYNQ